MLERRNIETPQPELTNGPGKLTQALNISTRLDGIDLTDTDSPIIICENDFMCKDSDIITSPRVGIDYAEEYILKPWRFRLKGNIWAGK
jgi:DNA-3-methyladenine glycosylase